VSKFVIGHFAVLSLVIVWLEGAPKISNWITKPMTNDAQQMTNDQIK